jgi:hypothetical protein
MNFFLLFRKGKNGTAYAAITDRIPEIQFLPSVSRMVLLRYYFNRRLIGLLALLHSHGQLAAMVSSDALAFREGLVHVNNAWAAPLQLIIMAPMLYMLFGESQSSVDRPTGDQCICLASVLLMVHRFMSR